MNVDWNTRRIGQNIAGRRYVCPTLAPDPLPPSEPECMEHTGCTRCGKWVCPDHNEADYVECSLGIHCLDCHESLTPDRDCMPDDDFDIRFD